MIADDVVVCCMCVVCVVSYKLYTNKAHAIHTCRLVKFNAKQQFTSISAEKKIIDILGWHIIFIVLYVYVRTCVGACT